jgi:hypothetical protein
VPLLVVFCCYPEQTAARGAEDHSCLLHKTGDALDPFLVWGLLLFFPLICCDCVSLRLSCSLTLFLVSRFIFSEHSDPSSDCWFLFQICITCIYVGFRICLFAGAYFLLCFDLTEIYSLLFLYLRFLFIHPVFSISSE